MDLALDLETGDLDVSRGVHFVTGGDAIRQDAARRFRTILGEWFLNLRAGVDYFGQVFVRNPNVMVVRSLFRRTLAGTPGVTSVASFELRVDRETRELSVSWGAETDAGDVVGYEDLVL